MQAWAANEFFDDWGHSQPSRQITPEGLDRAALESCVGAAMYPGIEASFHIRDKFPYIEPFRLDADQVQPGDVTQQMSIPWQTDFVDCSDGDSPFAWWPAQRPIDIHVIGSTSVVRWARDFGKGLRDLAAGQMVRDWWRLGLLKPDGCGVVETLRIKSSPRSSRRKRR
jgi:L-lysine epsilon oxidase C-terminal domain